jgi:AGCS family alanine or glycine:cation symporter
MLGTFIDTLLICSVTGFVILLTNSWDAGTGGAGLSTQAFASALPNGGLVVSIGLSVFAFTTILGWSYYCERCLVYLVGVKAILPFRVLWIIAIPLGAMSELDFIWLLADTLNAMMAIPNLIALLLLSPVVFRLTRQGLERLKQLD